MARATIEVRGGLAALTLAALAACDTTVPTPEAYELANIDLRNVVPKSSPTAFVASFERYCLDAGRTAPTISAALRATDYVRVPGGMSADTWVVDDKRPAVLLARDGSACAVKAEARTGQTERVRQMIARRFPGAPPLGASERPAGMESVWMVDKATNTVIFTKRQTPMADPSRLMLGIVQVKSGKASG